MITSRIEQPKVFVPITIPNPLPSIKEQICIAPMPIKIVPDDPYNDMPFPAVPSTPEVAKVVPVAVPVSLPISAIPDPGPVYFEMNKSLVVPPLSPEDEAIFRLPSIGIPVHDQELVMTQVPEKVALAPFEPDPLVVSPDKDWNPAGPIEVINKVRYDPYGGGVEIVPLVTKAPDTLGIDFDGSKNDIPNPDEDWPNLNPDLITKAPANEIPDDPNPSTEPKNLNIPIFGNVSVPVFVGILLTLIIIFKGK